VIHLKAAISAVAILLLACCGSTQPLSDPRPVPIPFPGPTRALTTLSAAPNPALTRDVVDIAVTLTTNDGSSAPIYWNSTFGVFGGPPNAVPPGAIMQRAGGPVSPGTVVHVAYTTVASVDAVFSVFPSFKPVASGALPQDGSSSTIFLHVH
jgi:hypothetical protein